ncbi:MAG: fibronectin type III domain-containing protein [Lachnospiraceae bacterium]
MKKQILSILLTICMVLILVPTTVFAEGAEGAGRAYTLIEGTPGSTYSENAEGPGELIDGTTDTKWCVTEFKDAYIIFKTSTPVNISGYSITTGNDNYENPGRNPKSWTLYGCENYTGNSTDNWVEIHSISNDTVLQDENFKKYDFVFDKTETAYQYYKLEITAIQAGDVMQMSEFALIDCAHDWEVEERDPTSCTDQGYKKSTCSRCGGVMNDIIAPLAHDFSGGDGKCIYCSKTKEELFKISVSAYATKEQLMDNTFAPNSNGEATNIGKLVFGKNKYGNSQEWYILGKDDEVTGDNTIVFAALPIIEGQQFYNNEGNPNYDYAEGTGYGSDAGSIEVFKNHYGASLLRKALQDMAKNENCFTQAEQGMMNVTTVTTYDTKNEVYYTTTDTLYAPASGGLGTSYNNTIKVGSNDDKVLLLTTYFEQLQQAWTRTPDASNSEKVHYMSVTSGNGYVMSDVTTGHYCECPASNLNLSSVLFASNAQAASSNKAESGVITPNKAMSVRLDGKDKNIGQVMYNTTTGDINAVKGSTEGNVALVVQGNDGENGWYYSKKIGTTETINVSDIKEGIDLSYCKIWLETKDTDGMLYAVNVSEHQHSWKENPAKKASLTEAGYTAYRECSVCHEIEGRNDIPRIGEIKLSSSSYTYTGKVKKPSVIIKDSTGKTLDSKCYSVNYASGRKNIGIYNVTVTLKGDYEGSKVLTFKINPKGTLISKISGSKKAFTVKWKKQSAKMATSRITGYQIRYSTSSKMTNAKTKTVKGYKSTSKKITNLKAKKKYYVQVRTYMTVNGKTYYSSWSKAKSVKIK